MRSGSLKILVTKPLLNKRTEFENSVDLLLGKFQSDTLECLLVKLEIQI